MFVSFDRTGTLAGVGVGWVEGIHDAELGERVWGHDLRVEGTVVEPLDGIDNLAAKIAGFGTAPHRRLGLLVDHLVVGSKDLGSSPPSPTRTSWSPATRTSTSGRW